MRPRSKRDQFYREVGEVMSMSDAKSFINMETLDVEIHPIEDEFGFSEEEEDDEVQKSLDNPGKFLRIETLTSSESFRVMETFAESVREKRLQSKLIQALEGKKPFANFKMVVDNSPVRQAWFDFRDDAYAEMAKQWIEDNAPEELKEKIKQLPAVFIA